MGKTLQLGLYFAGWYAFNIYFNIYNKQVLGAFPFPWTCTLVQFAGGIVIASVMWLSTLKKAPNVSFHPSLPAACSLLWVLYCTHPRLA